MSYYLVRCSQWQVLDDTIVCENDMHCCLMLLVGFFLFFFVVVVLFCFLVDLVSLFSKSEQSNMHAQGALFSLQTSLCVCVCVCVLHDTSIFFLFSTKITVSVVCMFVCLPASSHSSCTIPILRGSGQQQVLVDIVMATNEFSQRLHSRKCKRHSTQACIWKSLLFVTMTTNLRSTKCAYVIIHFVVDFVLHIILSAHVREGYSSRLVCLSNSDFGDN